MAMDWSTGRMINAGAQQGSNPMYSSVANAMGGSSRYPSVYSGGLASQGAQAAGYPWYHQNFGSGITMPQGGASSQAIASFANLPPGSPAGATSPPPVAQPPAGRPSPYVNGPLPQNSNDWNTSKAGGDAWWNAVAQHAMPAGSYNNQQIGYDDWVKNMNATQQYGQSKGMSQDDLNSMLSGMNTTSVNNFGADPAANYNQYTAYRTGADQAAAAQQAAGSANWLPTHDAAPAPAPVAPAAPPLAHPGIGITPLPGGRR